MLDHVYAEEWTKNETGHWHVCNCGAVTETVEHNFGEGKVTIQATCTKEGEMKFTCDTCAYVKTEVTSVVDKHIVRKVNAVAATCTQDGNIAYYICKDCNTLFADENGTQPLTEEDVIVPATNHVNAKYEIIKEATCTEDGSKKFVCPDCDAYDSNAEEVIPASGHTMQYVSTTDATCTAVGFDVYECSVCHAEEKRNETVALGHTETSEVTVEPTCTAEGEKVVTCSVCHVEIAREVLAMTAHEYESQTFGATCLVDGYVVYTCDCGHSYTEAGEKSLGAHTWTEVTTDASCTADGFVVKTCGVDGCGATETVYPEELKSQGHDFVAATCEEDGYCSICFAEGEKAHGHELNVVQSEVLPTCTEKGYIVYECKYGCGSTVSVTPKTHDAKGHDLENIEWTQTQVRANEGECYYFTRKTGVCPGCGETVVQDSEVSEEATHTYAWVTTTYATCNASGEKQYKCAICGDVNKTEEYTESIAHTWNEGELQEDNVTTLFTCGACGEQKKTVAAEGSATLNQDTLNNSDELALNNATLVFDQDTKDQLTQDGDVTIGAGELSNDEVKNIVGGLGVENEITEIFDFTVNGGGKTFDGEVIVRIPYTLQDGDNPNELIVCYLKPVGDGTYEPEFITATYVVIGEQGYAQFATKHFSYYTVTYMTPAQICEFLGQHAYVTTSRPATCLTDGYTINVCARCGDMETLETVPAIGHDLTTTTVAATCTKNGYETTKCKRCDVSYTEKLPALSHSWIDDVENSKTATCKASGIAAFKCENCDKTYSYKTKQLDHAYAVTEVIKADCTNGGYTVYTCAGCQDSYQADYVAALGHTRETLRVEPTCIADGYVRDYCTVCDKLFEISEVLSATGDHDWDREEADCDNDQVCKHCKKVGGLKKGHNHGTDGKCKNKNCNSVCEHVEYKYKGRVNATCTNKGYDLYVCKKCHHEDRRDFEGNEPKHNYEQASTVEATCTNKGYTVYECKGCGSQKLDNYVDTVAHDYKVLGYVEATCLNQGYRESKCENCGLMHYDEFTDFGACIFVVVDEVEVTCTKDGYVLHQCQYCGETQKTDVVTALGHDYNRGNCVRCGHKEEDGGEYFYLNMIQGWKDANGFALNLENLSVELGDFVIENGNGIFKKTFSLKQVDVTSLMLTFNDGELYGAGKGKFTVQQGRGELQTYNFEAIIQDGSLYLQAKMGMQMGYAEVTLDYILQEMTGGMPSEMLSFVLDWAGEYVLPVLGDFAYENAAIINDILGGFVEMLFSVEDMPNGKQLRLDYTKLKTLNENLATMTVDQLVDTYFGEGAYAAVENAVMTVLNVKMGELLDFASSIGFTKDKTVAAVNSFMQMFMGEEDFDVESMLGDFSVAEITIADLIAEMMNSNQGGNSGGEIEPDYPVDKPDYPNVEIDPDNPIYKPEYSGGEVMKPEDGSSEEIIIPDDGFTKPVEGDNNYTGAYSARSQQMTGADFTAQMQEVFAMLKQGSVYEMFIGETQQAKEMVDMIISMLENSVTFGFDTKDNGVITDVIVAMKDFVVPTGEDEQTQITFDVTFTVNGTIDVTWGDIVKKIEEMQKLPQIDGDFTFGGNNGDGDNNSEITIKTDEKGNIIEFVESNRHCYLQGEGEMDYEGVTYYMQSYEVNESRYVVSALNSSWSVSDDCGDWKLYSMMNNGRYMHGYYYMAVLRDIETGEVVRVLYGNPKTEEIFDYLPDHFFETDYRETGVDFFYNAVTGEFATESHHNFVKDEEKSYAPESCGDMGCNYYVCDVCGMVQENYYSMSHNTRMEYRLHEGATSCEQGVDMLYICVNCGEITHINEYWTFGHQTTTQYVVNGTDVGRQSACICGEFNQTENGYGQLHVVEGLDFSVTSTGHSDAFEIQFTATSETLAIYGVSAYGEMLSFRVCNESGKEVYRGDYNDYVYGEVNFEVGKVYTVYFENVYNSGWKFYVQLPVEPEVIDLTEYGSECGGTFTVYTQGLRKSSQLDLNCKMVSSEEGFYYCAECGFAYAEMTEYTQENCVMIYRYTIMFCDDINAENPNTYEYSYSYDLGKEQHNYSNNYQSFTEEREENGITYTVHINVDSYECMNCGKVMWKNTNESWYRNGKELSHRVFIHEEGVGDKTVVTSRSTERYTYRYVGDTREQVVSDKEYEYFDRNGYMTSFELYHYYYQDNSCLVNVVREHSNGFDSYEEYKHSIYNNVAENNYQTEWKGQLVNVVERTDERICRYCGYVETKRVYTYYYDANDNLVAEFEEYYQQADMHAGFYRASKTEKTYQAVEVNGVWKSILTRLFEEQFDVYGNQTYFRECTYAYEEGNYCFATITYNDSNGKGHSYQEENHAEIASRYVLSEGSVTCNDGLDYIRYCTLCSTEFEHMTDWAHWHVTQTVEEINFRDYGAECDNKAVIYGCPCGESYYSGWTLYSDSSFYPEYVDGRSWNVCGKCDFAYSVETDGFVADEYCNVNYVLDLYFRHDGVVQEVRKVYQTSRKEHLLNTKLILDECSNEEYTHPETGRLTVRETIAEETYCEKCFASISKISRTRVYDKEYEFNLEYYATEYAPYLTAEETGYRPVMDEVRTYGIVFLEGNAVQYPLTVNLTYYNSQDGSFQNSESERYVYKDGSYCYFTYIFENSYGEHREEERYEHWLQDTRYELSNPNSTTCEDGVTTIIECLLCGEETERREYDFYYHNTYIRDRLSLSNYGSVCGGYADVYTCACGYEQSIGVNAACNMESYYDYQYETESGQREYTKYTYVCSVTEPTLCGFTYTEETWRQTDKTCQETYYTAYTFSVKKDGSYADRKVFARKTGNYLHTEEWYETKQSETKEGEYTVYVEDSGCICMYCGTPTRTYKTTRYLLNGSDVRQIRVETYYHGSGVKSSEHYYDDIRVQTTFRDNVWNSWVKAQQTHSYFDQKGNRTDYQDYVYEYPDETYCQYIRTYNWNGNVTTEYVNAHSESWGSYEYSEWAQEPTCTQEGIEHRICIFCYDELDREVAPYQHNYSYHGGLNLYVCVYCGLQNETNADGELVLEDLTSNPRYATGSDYVVGHCVRSYYEGNVKHDISNYIMTIGIVPTGSQQQIEIYNSLSNPSLTLRNDYSMLFLSIEDVETLAQRNGYSHGEYMVRVNFVPMGGDGSYVYAITLDTHVYEKGEFHYGDCGFTVSAEKCKYCNECAYIYMTGCSLSADSHYEQNGNEKISEYTYTCLECEFSYRQVFREVTNPQTGAVTTYEGYYMDNGDAYIRTYSGQGK